ncbi:MAG: transcriptional regulator [Planctomycetaceae bacterium]|nr:transcriptional regulator [Planctomycetaceae bacterium]
MKFTIDEGDRQFLEELNRLGEATIQDVCDAIGVTATAVRQRLTRLQASGFVARKMERAGRGRPHHRYHVTDSGLRQLGENYAELAQILWREIGKIPEGDVQKRVVAGIRQALIDRYRPVVQADSLSGRMGQLQEALTDHGFDVEIDASRSLPILRENNCPYHELASEDSSICEMEQEVFEQVLGTSVTLTSCCLDGHHCCEFEAAEVK